MTGYALSELPFETGDRPNSGGGHYRDMEAAVLAFIDYKYAHGHGRPHRGLPDTAPRSWLVPQRPAPVSQW